MKYLKRFDESEYKDAEEFIKDNLSFLLDDYFNLSRENLYNTIAIFSLIKKNQDDKINWDQIKDDYIPFLGVLRKNYNIYSFHWENKDCNKNQVIELFDNEKYDITYHTLEEFMNDEIECNDIKSLSIKINYKKRLE